MKRLFLILAIAAIASAICLAQGKKSVLAFDQIFPQEKQRQMGLQKLSAEEKEALLAHVETLLTTALKEKPGGRGGGVYPGVGGGHWIKENIDRGTFIVLEDRSLWRIDPLDKIDASLWLKVSSITVVESSSGSPGYDYLLINTDDREKAHAKYMGKQ